MPALENENVKYVNGLKIDKEDKNVYYSDESHVYVDKEDGVKYISVTTLIHNYVNEFDAKFWSSYKACEALLGDSFVSVKSKLLASKRWDPKILKTYDISEDVFSDKCQEILDGYDAERIKSCERGTKIHAEFENQFYKSEVQELKQHNLHGSFVCKKGHYQLDLEKGIYPEFLISFKEEGGTFRIAGQIDLLIKDGNDIIIGDYKTNKKLDKESFFDRNIRARRGLKFPLSHIMDCNYYHYVLQLSTYAYLLQKHNPDFNIKRLFLIHIDHDGNESEHECPYLKDDVMLMLRHYKKSTQVKRAIAADLPMQH